MVYAIKDVKNALGTLVAITIVHPDVDEGIRALRTAFDEVYRIHDLMSVHNQSGEVGVLNRKGYYEGMSKDTNYVIQRANYFSKLSDGAFDITVLPILRLWEENARKEKAPGEAEISRTLELINYKDVVLEDDSIGFRKAGMGITLAGVAKGYAVDRAVETLRNHKIRHALVNAGGDIRAIGGKTDMASWKVAVRDPIRKTRSVTTVELNDQAIATSGSYRRSFNDIMNPKTGKPAQGVLSSTIVANRAIDADILATCLFIMGVEKGVELVGRLDGARAIVMKSDESLLKWNA